MCLNMDMKINIIETISKKEGSEIDLVNFEGGTTIFKLRKYNEKSAKELFTRIKKVESRYIYLKL